MKIIIFYYYILKYNNDKKSLAQYKKKKNRNQWKVHSNVRRRAGEIDRTALRDRYNCEMQVIVDTVSVFTEL